MKDSNFTDNKLYALMWVIVGVVLCSLISGITIYNIHKNEMPLRMIKNGVNPAVLECLDKNWTYVSVHEICKNVLTDSNLTNDEANELVEKLR